MPGRKNQFLSAKEKMEVFSILSVIIKTGVSLQTVLSGQLEESRNQAQRWLYRRIILAADKGKGISDALEGINGFTKTDVNLMRAAEKTGNLPNILSDLASFYRQSDIFRSKMFNALFIPALAFIAACFIAAFPALFKHGLIRFLFDSSIYIFSLSVVFLIGFALFRLLKNMSEKNKKASLLYYSIPLWGKMERKLDIYRFSKLMSLSISAGLGMADCLETSAAGVRGYMMKEEIFKTRYSIEKKGMTLQEAFSASESFGNLMKKMIAGGEISGTLQATMAKLADYLYEELSTDMKNLIKVVNIVTTVIVMLFLVARIFMLASGIYSRKSF